MSRPSLGGLPLWLAEALGGLFRKEAEAPRGSRSWPGTEAFTVPAEAHYACALELAHSHPAEAVTHALTCLISGLVQSQRVPPGAARTPEGLLRALEGPGFSPELTAQLRGAVSWWRRSAPDAHRLSEHEARQFLEKVRQLTLRVQLGARSAPPRSG